MTRETFPEESGAERDRIILDRLRSQGGALSGELLATELGLSRVAVRKRIDILRGLGYRIEASRLGYELFGDDGLAPGELGGQAPVTVRASMGSTQDEARRQAQAGAPSGSLVLAAAQSEGRGRLGRAWASPPGGLYLSLVLRSPLPPVAAGAFVLEAAACLRELLGKTLAFRWPNDLYLEGRKAGGILLEFSGSLERAEWYVLGVGLNMEPVRVPGRSTASLTELPEPPRKRRDIALALARRLEAWAKAPRLNEGLAAALAEDLPCQARLLFWDGSSRDIDITGMNSRGELATATGDHIAPGECRRASYKGDKS
jgi:BirA family biotin operon repressor/biotin-[acetyl-CoA-carboxylase] ligase